MSAGVVAQVWCPRCQREVIVTVPAGQRTASCPWCDRRIRVPREAVA